MSGTPHYPPDPASDRNRIRSMLNDVMTAARTRVKFAKILAEALTVGVEGGARIEFIPDNPPKIKFYTVGGGEHTLSTSTNSLRMETAGESIGFPTEASMTVEDHRIQSSASHDGGDELAAVYAQVESTPPRGEIQLIAWGSTDSDIIMSCDGVIYMDAANNGIEIPTSGDPPAPANGIRLYAKAGRMYYRSSSGTIYGPLG